MLLVQGLGRSGDFSEYQIALPGGMPLTVTGAAGALQNLFGDCNGFMENLKDYASDMLAMVEGFIMDSLLGLMDSLGAIDIGAIKDCAKNASSADSAAVNSCKDAARSLSEAGSKMFGSGNVNWTAVLQTAIGTALSYGVAELVSGLIKQLGNVFDHFIAAVADRLSDIFCGKPKAEVEGESQGLTVAPAPSTGTDNTPSKFADGSVRGSASVRKAVLSLARGKEDMTFWQRHSDKIMWGGAVAVAGGAAYYLLGAGRNATWVKKLRS